MICPKCGFEQPDSLECMRCGIVISRYRGPVVGGAPAPSVFAAPPPPPPPVAKMASTGTMFGDPSPVAAGALAGGGTLYQGPMPEEADANGGTVYGGTVYGGQAPAAGRKTQGRFEVGQVLSESFTIYFSNFIPFALLTGIALLPLYFLQAYVTATGFEADSPAALQGYAPVIFLFISAILCPYLATGAITYGVFQQMRGRDASIGDCLSRGLSSLLPVVGLAIIQGFRIFVGLMLCIIPGILWALKWSVSIPAAVEEKAGVGGSMARSDYLTDGYRGEVFGVLFVLNILDTGTTLVVTMFAAKNQELAMILTGVKSLLTVGLSATATAVMYYRLRSVKESIDVEQISSVFA